MVLTVSERNRKMFSSKDYVRIISKRIGLVISLAALFGIIAVFNYFYATKRFETSTIFALSLRKSTTLAAQIKFLK